MNSYSIKPTDTAGSGSREIAKLGSPMLRRYLHEVGVTPLLDEKEEVRLASQLGKARREIARLALALPTACREFALEGIGSDPVLGAKWPLSHLEMFLDRLGQYAAQQQDAKTAATIRKMRTHKSSLDEARDALVLANLRLVVHIAKKYVNRGLPFMDLIQEGNVGLLRAVEGFEHERGHRFSTYAFWWIKQGIERGLSDKSRTIRVPMHVNEDIRKVYYAARDLDRTLGRSATPLELATHLTMTVEAVETALSVVREPLPLDHANGDREGDELAKMVPDDKASSPLQDALQHQLNQRVEVMLRKLNSREETIIRMRFGIGCEATRTLEQIGEKLRLSRERVRQLERLALAKIKASPLCRDLAEWFVNRSVPAYQ
jgi:RNA polymerase primary sigma factor